jgi:hydrogenase nickel incorporation protein HypA/HybF
MHELSVASTILDMVEAEARKAGLSKVAEVRIVVGPLSGVDVESLEFCFRALVDQSWSKGARLNIAVPAGVMRCRSCGQDSEFTKMSYVCPRCGSVNVAVDASRELQLSEIRGE